MPESNLPDIFDRIGRISITKYFLLRYDKLPSTMNQRLPIPEMSEVYPRLLTIFEEMKFDVDSLFKRWRIAKFADSEDKEDVVVLDVLQSNAHKLCIELSMYPGNLLVEFLYDQSEPELEQRVLATARRIRAELGENKSPTFEVLTRSDGDFDTEKVVVDSFDIALEQNYNDDLQEVDEVIQRSIGEKKSGLILLHGIPGTGKTSYIKSLLARHEKSKFIFIPNDFVQEILQPQFMTFLLQHRDSILVIEDAEKVIMSRQNSGQNSVVSTILQITDGLFSDYLNIKIICTFNTDVSRIDQALFRKGRMIAFYEFKELSEEKARKLLPEELQDQLPERLTLAEIYNIREKTFKVGKTKKIGFRR